MVGYDTGESDGPRDPAQDPDRLRFYDTAVCPSDVQVFLFPGYADGAALYLVCLFDPADIHSAVFLSGGTVCGAGQRQEKSTKDRAYAGTGECGFCSRDHDE